MSEDGISIRWVKQYDVAADLKPDVRWFSGEKGWTFDRAGNIVRIHPVSVTDRTWRGVLGSPEEE